MWYSHYAYPEFDPWQYLRWVFLIGIIIGLVFGSPSSTSNILFKVSRRNFNIFYDMTRYVLENRSKQPGEGLVSKSSSILPISIQVRTLTL